MKLLFHYAKLHYANFYISIILHQLWRNVNLFTKIVYSLNKQCFELLSFQGYTDEPISKILSNVSHSDTVLLDRWSLLVEKNKNAESVDGGKENLPLNVVNNYYSLGVDAHIALEFHEARGKFLKKHINFVTYILKRNNNLYKTGSYKLKLIIYYYIEWPASHPHIFRKITFHSYSNMK